MIEACFLSIMLEVSLHVREEPKQSNRAQPLVRFQTLRQFDRIDSRRVKIADDQCGRIEQRGFSQRISTARKANANAQLFGRAANLRREEKIVNDSDYCSGHARS